MRAVNASQCLTTRVVNNDRPLRSYCIDSLRGQLAFVSPGRIDPAVESGAVFYARSVEFRVLGPVEVIDEGQAVSLGGRKQRTVLGILIAWVREPVSVDKLVEGLWGSEPPERGRGTIQTYISNLRGLIGDKIDFRSDGYVLEVDPEAVDRLRFEDLIAEGRTLVATDPANARNVLLEALSLWRGPPFENVDDHSLLRPVVTELEETRLAGLESRIEADLAVGRHLDVIGELESLCEEFPLSEGFRKLHMLALYRAGRQGDALRAFQKTESDLAEMGIEPSSDLRQLEQEILEHSPALHPETSERSLSAAPSLPRPRTRLVGRRAEVEAIENLVGSHRLVTLTGIGGAGKTRVAIEVGLRLEDLLPDGVFFVDLSSVDDEQRVAQEISRQLGIPLDVYRDSAVDPLQELVMHLTDQEILLIVDNCEHLLDACAKVIHEVTTRCAQVQVLATSRQPLGVVGEQVRFVGSLSLEGEEAEGGAAVELLTERLLSLRPDFDVDASRVDLGRIAERLDGIPLALELAVPSIALLGASAVVSRLDERLGFPVGGKKLPKRQQTLEATLDWSHELLEEGERLLFRRLAVFVGGFDLEAAEHVCSSSDGSDRIVNGLGGLVDKSLVMLAYSDGEPRYRMLETVRSYAEAKLFSSHEVDETRTHHRDWYLQWLGRKTLDEAWGDIDSVEELETEWGNLSHAIEFSIDREEWDTASRYLINMLGSSFHRGRHREVRSWSEQIMGGSEFGDTPHSVARIVYDYTFILDRNLGDEAPGRTQGKVVEAMKVLPEDHPARLAAYFSLMASSTVMNDPDRMLYWGTKGRRYARRLGFTRAEMACRFNGGLAHLFAQDFTAAVAVFESFFSAPESPDLAPGWTPYHLAISALLAGDETAARKVIDTTGSKSSTREPQVDWMALALAQAAVGDLSSARAAMQKAVEALRSVRWVRPFALRELLLTYAFITFLEGDLGTAMRHLAAARGETKNITYLPAGVYIWRHLAGILKQRLPPGLRKELIEEGKTTSVEEAVEEQLEMS